MRKKVLGLGVAAVLAAGLTPAVAAAASSTAAKPVPLEVRVNQVGYASKASKLAYVMIHAKVARVVFTISDSHGIVLRGSSRHFAGAWNSRYGAVYSLTFTRLSRSGRYRIRVSAAGETARSPWFRIGSPASLYHRLVTNAVRYFTSERDGPDVDSAVLDRQPANLTDEHAYVYPTPKYDDNDNLLSNFSKKIGGPVNVAGGWFDAGGGYEKFGYTAAYADGLMLIADRDNPGEYPTLNPEAQYGLNWLEKLWNPAKKVMYMQVGIGNGNASNTIQGDYNFWLLPQGEDHLDLKKGGNPGPTAYYVKYRPVFEAAPAGKPISPDLAGRFAADFALAAQVACRDPRQARHLLSLARGVYAMAQTKNVKNIVTAYPHDYYPGSEWQSDMLWGADEIALADEALHAPAARVHADLEVAAHWARAYLAEHHSDGDTLNLYDNGAIGEGELLQAMARARGRDVIAPRLLVSDLAAQLRIGESYAKGDPFEPGTVLGPNDATPHAFGLYITNALYQRYGGSSKYAAFAQQQLNFNLGANAWGSSFVVGAGTTFPQCMQSEIANLAGSLNGRGNIQLGAVSDGPSSAGNFIGLGAVSGMRACSAGHYGPFNTKTVGYEDNVVSWPSVEPALDYTANSLLAFSLAASG